MGVADGVGESRDAKDDLDCPLEPGSSSWGRWERWEVGLCRLESDWWMRELQSIAAAKKVGDGSLAVPPSYDPLVYKRDIYIPRGSPGTTDMESKTPKTGTTYLGT